MKINIKTVFLPAFMLIPLFLLVINVRVFTPLKTKLSKSSTGGEPSISLLDIFKDSELTGDYGEILSATELYEKILQRLARIPELPTDSLPNFEEELGGRLLLAFAQNYLGQMESLFQYKEGISSFEGKGPQSPPLPFSLELERLNQTDSDLYGIFRHIFVDSFELKERVARDSLMLKRVFDRKISTPNEEVGIRNLFAKKKNSPEWLIFLKDLNSKLWEIENLFAKELTNQGKDKELLEIDGSFKFLIKTLPEIISESEKMIERPGDKEIKKIKFLLKRSNYHLGKIINLNLGGLAGMPLVEFAKAWKSAFDDLEVFNFYEKKIDDKKIFEKDRLREINYLFGLMERIQRNINTVEGLLRNKARDKRAELRGWHLQFQKSASRLLNLQFLSSIFLAALGLIMASFMAWVLGEPLSQFASQLRHWTGEKEGEKVPLVKMAHNPMFPKLVEFQSLEDSFGSLSQQLNKIWEKKENRAEVVEKIVQIFSKVSGNPQEWCQELLEFYREKKLIPQFSGATFFRVTPEGVFQSFRYKMPANSPKIPKGLNPPLLVQFSQQDPRPPFYQPVFLDSNQLNGEDLNCGLNSGQVLYSIPQLENSESRELFGFFILERDLEPWGDGEKVDPTLLEQEEIRTLLQAFRAFHKYLENFALAREKEQIDTQLELARTIQLSLIPKRIPQLMGVELDFHYQPARVIGGDYLDFFPIGESKMAVCIADVSGKNVSAALLMSIFRSIIWTLKDSPWESPGEFVTRINHTFCAQNRLLDRFITFFFLVLDGKSREVSYCSAGHPPFLLQSPDGTIEEVVEPHLPIGISEEVEYSTGTLKVQPGGRLILYTDGVTEAKNPIGEDFGLKRVLDLLRGSNGKKGSFLKIISENLQLHFNGSPPNDDVSLIEIKFAPSL